MGFMSTFRTDLADTLTRGSLVGSTTDGIIRPDKRPTFVVNSVKLRDFVTNLIYDLDGYF